MTNLLFTWLEPCQTDSDNHSWDEVNTECIFYNVFCI